MRELHRMRAPYNTVGSLTLVVLALASSCHRELLGAQGTLDGLRLPLVPAANLKVAVRGRVMMREALVQFDPGTALSVATRGCFEARPLSGEVTVADPLGPDAHFVLSVLEGVTLGPVRLAPWPVGLVEGAGCLVVLGDDVLRGHALEVDTGQRQVTLRTSRSSEHWLSERSPSDEVQVLALTREPRHDWPLVPIRVVQGEASYTTSVLFSVREPRTRLFAEGALQAGLRAGPDLFKGLAPAPSTLPRGFEGVKGFVVERVELAVGVGTEAMLVEAEPGSAVHGIEGVLGVDVWSRFNAIIDVPAGVVVLHRPKVVLSGDHAQCERAGERSLERCFEIVKRKTSHGFELGLSVWKALPEGAHVAFELAGTEAPCRLGLSFAASDRGQSTFHQWPWSRLTKVMPECAAALTAAVDIVPATLEEGQVSACPGLCAFAQPLGSNRVTCECQAIHPTLEVGAERRLIELYRTLKSGRKQVELEEPLDP